MIFIKDKQMLCFNLGLTPTIPETESVSDKGSSPCWSDYLQEEASVLREAPPPHTHTSLNCISTFLELSLGRKISFHN